MTRFVLVIALCLLLPSLATAQRSTRTKGYVKKSTGTYVAPSVRTKPDRTRLNNYSAKGNANPYTGKKGTKDPYAPAPRKRKRAP